MGCAVLPHLQEHGGDHRARADGREPEGADHHGAVRRGAGGGRAPYGIESFDSVSSRCGRASARTGAKSLAAFLKAIGFIIPLMDAMYANYYTREVMVILIRELPAPTRR